MPTPSDHEHVADTACLHHMGVAHCCLEQLGRDVQLHGAYGLQIRTGDMRRNVVSSVLAVQLPAAEISRCETHRPDEVFDLTEAAKSFDFDPPFRVLCAMNRLEVGPVSVRMTDSYEVIGVAW